MPEGLKAGAVEAEMAAGLDKTPSAPEGLMLTKGGSDAAAVGLDETFAVPEGLLVLT